MRIEQLYEFIVPIIFLAIWAVTWILNRETQPLPPRMNRRERDEPPQSVADEVRNVERDRRDFRGSTAGSSFNNATSTPARTRRGNPSGSPLSSRRGPVLGPGDAIVFSEPEPTRQLDSFEKAAGLRPGRGGQGRRNRSKGGGAARSRNQPAPETTRELTQEISDSLAQLKARPLELTPLNQPLSPLSSLSLSPGSSFSAKATAPLFASNRPGPLDAARGLTDPAKLRELIIMNELLQPPLALRRGPYGRR